jgi:superfamily II DNA or RNA helicase
MSPNAEFILQQIMPGEEVYLRAPIGHGITNFMAEAATAFNDVLFVADRHEIAEQFKHEAKRYGKHVSAVSTQSVRIHTTLPRADLVIVHYLADRRRLDVLLARIRSHKPNVAVVIL